MNDQMKNIVEALTHPSSHIGLNVKQTCENITHRWVNTKEQSDMMLWHLRLRNTPFLKLSSMGLNIQANPNPNNQTTCVTCPMAKLTKLAFPLSESQTTYPFELIHIDTWGPYKVQTRGKHIFILTMVDHYTRTTW